jgi:ABC-type branched-subunit amino acid transport system substrate-binding protein
MIAVFDRARKVLAPILAGLAGLALAACDPIGVGGGASGPSIDASAPVPVALLVPGGSGQATDATLARSLENAARLAIADLGGVQIDLRVYNTAGNPQSAAAQARAAVADGAKIILGPVFAQEANAVGLAVAADGINVLSFSNNSAVAGGNVFVLGSTFDNTAARLLRHAARQGQRRVMIVHDRTPSGESGRAAIAGAAQRAGSSIVATVGYEFSQNGIVQAAPQIAANANSSGADAVFFTADTAGALPLLTQMLRDRGLSSASKRYLGLTRWDIPAATLALPGVQGGWFAMPDPATFDRFQARYSQTHGEAPHPIAGLAYDGIAAVGALVKSGNAQALTREALVQSSGFVGVSGVFRLLSNGSNERALAVAEIRNGQVIIIDPAPRNFAGTGF